MKLNIKNLPIVNLPYENINLCKQMMLKIYENLPFIAELPLIDPLENTLYRTVCNIPGIKLENKKILLSDSDTETFRKALKEIDAIYNSPTIENLEKFKFDAPFFEIYEQIIKRTKPHYTLIKFTGPFSFAEAVRNQNTVNLFTDKLYRKFLIQAFALKAMWFICKIQNLCSDTKVLILYDEQSLNNFSNLKREEELTSENVISILSKIYQKIHDSGGFVGVQSFKKCNWQIPIDAGADLLSFDAYNNPNNLNVIAENIKNFIINGGLINWGIVPVMNENIIKSINLDFIENKFKKTVENLSNNGVPYDLLLKHSTVSVQGDLSKIPVLHAEKALILANQLSKKLPHYAH